mgnify:CR=1 FL=1
MAKLALRGVTSGRDRGAGSPCESRGRSAPTPRSPSDHAVPNAPRGPATVFSTQGGAATLAGAHQRRHVCLGNAGDRWAHRLPRGRRGFHQPEHGPARRAQQPVDGRVLARLVRRRAAEGWCQVGRRQGLPLLPCTRDGGDSCLAACGGCRHGKARLQVGGHQDGLALRLQLHGLQQRARLRPVLPLLGALVPRVCHRGREPRTSRPHTVCYSHV